MLDKILQSVSVRRHAFEARLLVGGLLAVWSSPAFLRLCVRSRSVSSYLTYTDYVLKNPFYELEMPIRIEYFDTHINRLIQSAMGHSPHESSSRRDK